MSLYPSISYRECLNHLSYVSGQSSFKFFPLLPPVGLQQLIIIIILWRKGCACNLNTLSELGKGGTPYKLGTFVWRTLLNWLQHKAPTRSSEKMDKKKFVITGYFESFRRDREK